MKQLHDLQRAILMKLLYHPPLRYKDVKPSVDIPNNQLSFHLTALMQQGLVIKEGDMYTLSDQGKKYVNRFDVSSGIIKQQAMITTLVCCSKISPDGDRLFLLHTRKMNPFYGVQGLLGGKIRYGETIVEAAQRTLFEKSGLQGTANIIHVLHYRDFDAETKVLHDDQLLFLCHIHDPMGEIVSDEYELCEWVKESDLMTYIQKPFRSKESTVELIQMVKNAAAVQCIQEKDWYTGSY